MNKIVALGFFDGVHLGHRALLNTCVSLAIEHQARPAAITFDAHPQSLFLPNPPGLINSGADRQVLLRRFGMEEITVIPTTIEVMSTKWQDFLTWLLDDGAVGFVCGEDFRFGRAGEGNAQLLRCFCQERGLPCSVVPEQTMDGVRVSSTHIRRLIEEGKMETATAFLGHPHMLSGEVMPGRQLGRTIGVPTANILIPPEVIVPKYGVYACRATVEGKQYPAVTNIGSRPTVGGHQVRAESWLLDFDGDLYGKNLVLEFFVFLRPEQKFDSLELLGGQIRMDAAKTKKLLNVK